MIACTTRRFAPPLLLSVLVAAMLPSPGFAQGATASAGGDAVPARVSALEGELFLKTPFSDSEQEATLNMVMREGDELRAGDKTFAEIELPGRSFVRLASGSRVRIDRLEESFSVHLEYGAVYASQGEGPALAVTTAQHTDVGPLARSTARIELEGDGVVARVVSGSVEVTCGDRVESLAPGDPAKCREGRLEHAPRPPEDVFDAWSAEREKKVHAPLTAPAGVAAGEGLYELEGNGTWVSYESHWYWRPMVSVTWRPYWDGYWSWCDPFGWTWVSYAPWGYVTHHYGRWLWVGAYGWVWSPAPVFAGAWVSWAAFDGYLGWAPCDFYGRPVVIVSTHSYYDDRVWSFARPGYFWHGGGSWRQSPDGRVGAATAGAINGHEASRFQSPFFRLAPDEIHRLSPQPVKNPRGLAPEHAIAERGRLAPGPAETGAAPRVRANVAPESELPELMRREAARTFQPRDTAGDRPGLGLPHGKSRPSVPSDRFIAPETTAPSPPQLRAPTAPETPRPAPQAPRPSPPPGRLEPERHVPLIETRPPAMVPRPAAPPTPRTPAQRPPPAWTPRPVPRANPKPAPSAAPPPAAQRPAFAPGTKVAPIPTKPPVTAKPKPNKKK